MRPLGEESDLVLFLRFHFCFRVADLVLSGRCLTLRLAHFFLSDLSAHLLAPRCGKQTAAQLCTGRSKAGNEDRIAEASMDSSKIPAYP